MSERSPDHQGGLHIKEVGYDDSAAQMLAFEMVSALHETTPLTVDQAVPLFSPRLLELREIMVPNLIYTDQSIAADREYHLRQPWTD